MIDEIQLKRRNIRKIKSLNKKKQNQNEDLNFKPDPKHSSQRREWNSYKNNFIGLSNNKVLTHVEESI